MVKKVHHTDIQILLFNYLVIWSNLMSHKLFLLYTKELNYIYSSQDTLVEHFALQSFSV
jgi:hypothetical protein